MRRIGRTEALAAHSTDNICSGMVQAFRGQSRHAISTSTGVSSDHPSGSVYGQSVVFTATVGAGQNGTPTGSVQFQIDGVNTGSPVSLSGGTATFTTSMLTATGHTITAVYTSDDGNFTTSQGSTTEQVTRASLKITADDKTKFFGLALPTLTVSYMGFVNSDMSASLTTQPALTTTATTTSPVNNYAITVSGATSSNYTIQFVNGTMSVTKASTSAGLSSSAGSITTAQDVTFTATVTVTLGTGVPTGSVLF